MKIIITILAYAGALSLVSCSSHSGGGKDGDVKTVLLDKREVQKEPERMHVSEVKETMTYKGKEYHSVVVRRPDEGLSIVKNEEGERFVDNRITLRLTCAGRQVLEKVFTKETFASLVDARFMRSAVLQGMVFSEVTPQGFVYAASVGYPDSDLYVPVRITVTVDGKVSMIKEETMEDILPSAEETAGE